jgi:hypothetical protein
MKRINRECVQIRELLDAFADDELSGRQRTRAAQHLGCCSLCAEELRSIQGLIGMLSALPVVIPQHNLRLRIMQAVVAAPVVQNKCSRSNISDMPFGFASVHPWSWQLAACASAAAVFLLGFWTSWETSDQLINLFKTVRTKGVLVPADCYVASCCVGKTVISCRHSANEVNRNEADYDGVGAIVEHQDEEKTESLTEAIGLKEDEDGLYAVEM